MDLRTIFINEYGRLRSGFRLLIFVAGYIAIVSFLSGLVGLAYALLHDVIPSNRYAEFLQNLIYRVTLLVPALLVGYLCARFLEGLPWRALGLTFHDHWIRDLVVGSLIGVASLALGVGIAAALGGLKFAVNAEMAPRIATSLVSSGALFVVAALAEEAMFRGYPLQTLTRAKLAWLGVLLTSVPFALGHLWNPNVVGGFTFVNTSLAGIWLALAYLRTRSLWFPLGVHWGWNWALGSLFGLPVSGMHLASAPLLKGQDVGPAWLTGGTYGLEGGVAGTVALVIATLVVWKMPFVSPQPEMLKLTSEERPVRLEIRD